MIDLKLPDFLRGFQERLEDLKHLGNNWDSYGALPIAEKAITDSLHFIRLFYKLTVDRKIDFPAKSIFIVPTSDGGIQVEFSFGCVKIEVKFHGDLKAKIAVFQVFGPLSNSPEIEAASEKDAGFAEILSSVFAEYLTYIESRSS